MMTVSQAGNTGSIFLLSLGMRLYWCKSGLIVGHLY